jgi:diguanylate cyclase (GGDEF)-like protein
MDSSSSASSLTFDKPDRAGGPARTQRPSLIRNGANPLAVLGGLGAFATALVLVTEGIAGTRVNPGGAAVAAIGVGTGMLLVAFLATARGRAEWLDIAAVILMLLGTVCGALLPDALSAVAILPLGGAVLTLHDRRGRDLTLTFGLAFLAAMTGVAAACADSSTIRSELPRYLLESAAMLGPVYALVWYVGNRSWATARDAEHLMASQRRLLEVNERLLSTLDPESVLDLIADSLKAVVTYDNLSIYRVDWSSGTMHPVVARDRFAELILDTTFPTDVGITGWVVRHGEAQCVNDSERDPRVVVIPGTPAEPESLIVVPLLVSGKVAGTLNLGRMGRQEAWFTPAEFELARLFAGQASIALQNAETHRAISHRAATDALTQLQNRGAFDDRLDEIVSDPRSQPCALIMVDLDGLKIINDHRGHRAGDAILQAVGKAISDTVREHDQAFRYGGDEFAVLLPKTAPDEARQVADRVRRAIGRLDGGILTASAGVAALTLDAATKAGFVEAADLALYRAKAAGGNRTVISRAA